MREAIAQRGFARVAEINGRRIWTKLYGVWNAMRGRCNSPGTKDYKRYGARGIRICEEWNDYAVFRDWALSSGFRKGLTLDREDTNGNYEPNNCRWIPKGLQQDNTRSVRKLTVNGVTRPIPEWSRLTGIEAHIINSRVRIGWTHQEAVTIPVGGDRGAPRKPSNPRGRYERMTCPGCWRQVPMNRDGNIRRHPCVN